MGSLLRRARPGVPGQPARRGQERAPPAVRQRALRHRLRAPDRAWRYPDGHPYHHTPIGSMADLDAASLEDAQDVLPHLLRAEQRGAVGRRRHRPGADPRLGREVLRHHPRATTASRTPRDGSLPEPDGRRQLRELVEEDVPSRALMAAYRLPQDGTRASRRRRPGAHRARRRRVLPAAQPAGAPRPHRRRPPGFGLLRLAGAPSLGWLDVKTSGGVGTGRHRGRGRRGAGPVRRGAARRPRRWSAPRPSWSASGWTGWPPSAAGPTNCAATRCCSATRSWR